jgi:hypothetical protein
MVAHASRFEAAIFKSLGVRPGAADLLLWHDGKSFALELKADGGRVTKGQREFLSDMKDAGAYTCLAEGLDRALKTLRKLQRPRLSGRSQSAHSVRDDMGPYPIFLCAKGLLTTK